VQVAVNLLIALALAFLGTSQATVRESSMSFDDAEALAAVFAHPRILGEMEKWSRVSEIRSPVFLVVRDSVPICAEPRDESLPCVPREQFTRFVRDEGLQQRLGSAFSATVCQQLASSFEQRNSAGNSLPALPHPRIEFIEYEALLRSFESGAYRGRARGYAQFSLPGYTEDGKALVYASYSCGGLCGEGWLFLLSRTEGVWRVVHSTSLWIS
jgi:hypothetical protein